MVHRTNQAIKKLETGRKGQYSQGFTLIEVLIALVILAIAFTAVMFLMRSNIHQTNTVKSKLTANWVAMNVISSIQLGLQDPPTKDVNMHGQDQTLQWQATLSENSNPHYQRITVKVYQNGHRLAQRDGFIWRRRP